MPNPVQRQEYGYYAGYQTNGTLVPLPSPDPSPDPYQTNGTPVPLPTPDPSPDPFTSTPGYDQHNDLPTQSNQRHSYSQPSSGEPGWVAPVVGCLSGIILILIIVVVLILVRQRRRRNPNLPPIHDQMYIDYKVNKRAPLPAPRSEGVDNNASQTDTIKAKTFTYDYADGKLNKNKKVRNEEHSLIVRQLPHEYLDLTNSTDPGYSTVT